jgi:hypothetical protein
MIRPRVGVAGIEFVRDVLGSEEKEVVSVPLDVVERLLVLGALHGERLCVYDTMPPAYYIPRDTVLNILRQEASK